MKQSIMKGTTTPGKIPFKFLFDYMSSGYRLYSVPAFMPESEKVYFSAMDFWCLLGGHQGFAKTEPG